MFNALILIHEIGHAAMALFLGWKIEKVILLPFGGITLFTDSLNKSIFEEFLILIAGPIFQLLFYFIMQSINYSDTLMMYNWGIILFNIIPIYPLDGSKLFNLFLLKYFPFITSNLITFYSSIIIIIISIFLIFKNGFNLLLLIVLLFLFIKIINEILSINFTFNRFLLERLKDDKYYKKKRIIKGNKIKSLYRNSSHLFFFNNKYHLEKEILRKKFDFISKV